MNKHNLIPLIVIIFLVFSSCNKKNDSPDKKPNTQFGIFQLAGNPAQFSVDTTSNYFASTDEEIVTRNLTEGAKTFIWDFGDGSTSTELSPRHIYAKSGKYSLKLTAINKDNVNNVKVKTVNVTEKVLTLIRISSLNFNSGFIDQLSWPADQRANVYVEVKELQNNIFPEYTNLSYNGEVIYKSDLLKNITVKDVPIVINVNSGKTISKLKLLNGRYGFNIHVIDSSGTDHIISSNWGSGVILSYQTLILEKNSLYKLNSTVYQ